MARKRKEPGAEEAPDLFGESRVECQPEAACRAELSDPFVTKPDEIQSVYTKIRLGLHVWDMRYWNAYKDINEVTDIVSNIMKDDYRIMIESTLYFYIRDLLKLGEPIDKIVDAIMNNDLAKLYPRRKYPCMRGEVQKPAKCILEGLKCQDCE